MKLFTIQIITGIFAISLCNGCFADNSVSAEKKTANKNVVSEWMTKTPESWVWDTRIANLEPTPQLFSNPHWPEMVEDYVKIMKGYGINTIAIFGHYHFRMMYIDEWPELEKNIAIISETVHRHGMRFLAHHSATCIIESKQDKKIGIGDHTLKDIVTIDHSTGKTDLTESGLPNDGRIFLCPNNPLHFETYSRHIRSLIENAKIDGLMSDDVEFLSNYYTCTCEHCQTKFFEQTGCKLPPADDMSFWFNFDNPDFRRWSRFRMLSCAEHYTKLRKLLAEYPDRDIVLFNCNAMPVGVLLNVLWGVNLEDIVDAGVTAHYLEPMASTPLDYFADWYHHVLDMKMMRFAGRKENLPDITKSDDNLPVFTGWYPGGTKMFRDYFVSKEKAQMLRDGDPRPSDYIENETDSPTSKQLDQSMFIYSLNHTFADQLWLWWDYHQFKDLFAFDEKYPGVFKFRGSIAEIGLVFSAQTRNFYMEKMKDDRGVMWRDADDWYVNAWRGWGTTLLDENLMFDVLLDDDIEQSVSDRYKLLIVPNMAAMSDKQIRSIEKYVENGGVLLATHETSLMTKTGKRISNFGINKLLGVDSEGARKEADGRFKVNPDDFTGPMQGLKDVLSRMAVKGQIVPIGTTLPKDIMSVDIVNKNGQRSPGLIIRQYGKGKVIYTPLKPGALGHIRAPIVTEKGKAKWLGAHDDDYRVFMRECINLGLNYEYQVTMQPKTKGLICNAFEGNNNSIVVHILNTSGVERYKGGELYEFPITTNYPKLPGKETTIVIDGITADAAVLISPDIKEPKELKLTKQPDSISVSIPNEGIQRYGIVVIENK